MSDIHPDLAHISDVIISMRREIGILKAEMTERFDQNAATAAALHDRIQQAEKNLITHCDIDALNDGIAQSRNVLNAVATDVGACRHGVQTIKDVVAACKQAVEESQLHLRDRISDAQTGIKQAITTARQELGAGITTLQDSLLDAVGGVARELGKGIKTLNEAVASVVGGFGDQLSDACEVIITQTSLTRAPSREVLDGKMHEMRDIIEHTNTSFQNLPRTLEISLAEAMKNAAAVACDNTTREVQERLKKLYEELCDRIQDVQLEMRAGHFNSAARLANKLSSCCTSTIVKLRGIDNLPIRTLPTQAVVQF
ncbi:hypothetical protein BBO_09583 [Beauveria brongniartii RCEF 3172]|uniref:Uncharacterized protein n=1 Tax=Beauveria brongniartii RCEF 3172 TaxID=1081107 RepID=A0A162IDX4_9HYPO|nr:hypothetical protein BBO_09583 [Beauveria brongniartii RCEF 3172]